MTDYLNVPAVVGHEQFFMSFLEDDYTARGLNVTRQERSLVVSGKKPSSAIICAHIDRHGLISIGGNEYVYAAQYMREIKYGENNRLARQELEKISERFEGEIIYAYDPATGRRLDEGIIQTCEPCMLKGNALFFVKDMAKKENGVPLAYSRTARFDGERLKGQIDNAISLAVISELFQQGFEGTAILATEEEIGKSWIHIQGYLRQEKIETKNLVVLDTSPFADPEPIENGHVIFRNRDMSEEFNAALVLQLQERARELGLPFQVKDETMLKAGKTVAQLGSTELGRLVQWTEGRWNGATVQIPTQMYHSSNETTTAAAIRNYYLFLHNILIDDKLWILNADREET